MNNLNLVLADVTDPSDSLNPVASWVEAFGLLTLTICLAIGAAVIYFGKVHRDASAQSGGWIGIIVILIAGACISGAGTVVHWTETQATEELHEWGQPPPPPGG